MISSTLHELYRAPHRTDDHGTVWYRSLSNMDFVNPRVGWAVGSGQILRTRDAGETWTNQYSDYMSNAFFAPHKISMISRDSCWVIDTVGFGQIRCFHTNDGGRNWKAFRFEASAYLKDIFFINPRRGWLISDDGKVLGGGGTIHLTDNGGKSWDKHKLTIKGTPQVIRFVNSRQGWLVESVITKDQAKTIGRVLRSYDRGKNWELTATFERQILDLVVIDARRLLVCGEGGLLAGTWDGGKSWREMKTRTRTNLNSITFDSRLGGIVGGDKGKLLMTDDNVMVWKELKGPAERPNCVSACLVSRHCAFIAFDTSIHLLAFAE